MSDLTGLAAETAGRFKARSRIVSFAVNLFKNGLVLVGAAVAAYAQFRLLPKDAVTSPWAIAGLIAAGAVFAGGIFAALVEHDPFTDLSYAHRAIEAARARQLRIDEELENIQAIATETSRLRDLYTAMDVMRDAVRLAMTVPTGGEETTVGRLLESAERPLLLACDFAHPQHWTLCVFKADVDANTQHATLRCVAHIRSIRCDITQARKWPEGIGVAGSAYSRGMEIVIPDLLAEELGTAYALDGTVTRAYDRERYRAIIAVPIKIGNDTRPWGVVTATCSVPGHFSPDHVQGVRTVEGPRALAGMVALAIQACHRSAPTATAASSAPGPDTVT